MFLLQLRQVDILHREGFFCLVVEQIFIGVRVIQVGFMIFSVAVMG